MSEQKTYKRGQFTPGHTKSKGPRKVLTPAEKEIRELNQREVIRIMHKYMYMTKDELHHAEHHPDTKAFDLCVIAVLLKAINKGDQFRINFILDRVVGPVPKKVDLESQTLADIIADYNANSGKK